MFVCVAADWATASQNLSKRRIHEENNINCYFKRSTKYHHARGTTSLFHTKNILDVSLLSNLLLVSLRIRKMCAKSQCARVFCPLHVCWPSWVWNSSEKQRKEKTLKRFARSYKRGVTKDNTAKAQFRSAGVLAGYARAQSRHFQ